MSMFLSFILFVLFFLFFLAVFLYWGLLRLRSA